jgi:tetratricopeptide (TPR) repeat protein
MRKLFIVLVLCSFLNCFGQTNFGYFYSASDAIWKGRGLYEAGDYKGAISVYNDLITGLAPEGEVYRYRGDAKGKLRDYHGAILDYDRFLKRRRFTQDDDVYYSRGIAKNKLGDLKGAIADYIESISIKPFKGINFEEIRMEKFSSEVYSRAIEYFTKQISLDPDNGFLYTSRGIVELDSGDVMSACLDFRKARDVKNVGYIFNWKDCK